jgi:hypothetical protein
VRTDTDYSIEFNTINLATDKIKIKKNAFDNYLLLFGYDGVYHNITWVSDKDTERILGYIQQM